MDSLAYSFVRLSGAKREGVKGRFGPLAGCGAAPHGLGRAKRRKKKSSEGFSIPRSIGPAKI